MNEDKGFEIKCLKCGSTDCEIEYNYWDNLDGEFELFGFTLCCKNCGETE